MYGSGHGDLKVRCLVKKKEDAFPVEKDFGAQGSAMRRRVCSLVFSIFDSSEKGDSGLFEGVF